MPGSFSVHTSKASDGEDDGDSFPGMRTYAAWIVGLTLTGSSIACSSATYGLGDDDIGDGAAEGIDPAEAGESGAELGETGEDDSEGDGDGDGDGPAGDGDGDEVPMQMCMDPPNGPEVNIQLFGPYLAFDDCSEPTISARVDEIDGGNYELTACACGGEDCNGDDLSLSISVPDPTWLPQVELGTCYYFYFFAEEVEPGVCRRNRVDIAIDKIEPPWYSVGSASEDLDHNGLAITPVVADACTDGCGEWQVRDVEFIANEAEQTLAWGEVAPVGGYNVVNWQSYATPNGCGGPKSDVTAWTAR